MSKVHSQDFRLQLKSGLAADINATATKNMALEGEPHYTTDTNKLYVFNGNENIRVHGLDNALVYDDDLIFYEDEIVWLD